MPHCAFYAGGDDYRLIVDFVLTKTSCRIFEGRSLQNAPLLEFRSFAALEVLRRARGARAWPGSLSLWPIAANGAVRIRGEQYAANEKHPAWRFEQLEGWGVVQLMLTSPRKGCLSPSWTNHNSDRRASNWAATYPDMPGPDAWDFKAVNRESSRINRFIKKLSVGRRGTRFVLPGAQQLFDAGIETSLN
jgi:hypothetical protein